jgi:hypothetical protein
MPNKNKQGKTCDVSPREISLLNISDKAENEDLINQHSDEGLEPNKFAEELKILMLPTEEIGRNINSKDLEKKQKNMPLQFQTMASYKKERDLYQTNQ